LTPIHIPTEQEDAARDLLRCREDIRADLLRARHRLSKFLLRHGRRFTATKKAWSKRHDAWLRTQTWPLPALDQPQRAYLRAVDEAVARLRAVEQELRALLDLEPLRPRVQRLRCVRGVDDLTALTIAAELGDPRRFATAPRLMAFVGLIPSEHSSGTKTARGAITKTGKSEAAPDEPRSCGTQPANIRVIHRRCRSADQLTESQQRARPDGLISRARTRGVIEERKTDPAY